MFKPGDRVQVLPNHGGEWVGCLGTIIVYEEHSSWIEYDNPPYTSEQSNPKRWRTSNSCLTLLQPRRLSHLPDFLQRYYV